MHPQALEASLSDEQLQLLLDPFRGKGGYHGTKYGGTAVLALLLVDCGVVIRMERRHSM